MTLPHTLALAACAALLLGAQSAPCHAQTNEQDADESGEQALSLDEQLEQLREANRQLEARIQYMEKENKKQEDRARLYQTAFQTGLDGILNDWARGREVDPQAALTSVKQRIVQRDRKPYDEKALAEVELALARRFYRVRDYASTEEVVRQSIGRKRSTNASSMLLNVLAKQGEFTEVIAIREEMIAKSQRRADRMRNLISQLMRTHIRAGSYADAAKWVEEHLHYQEDDDSDHGAEHNVDFLIPALRETGQYEQAEQLARKSFEILREHRGEEEVKTFEAAAHLAWLLSLQNRDDEAAVWHQRANDLAFFMGGIGEPYASTVFGGYLQHREEYHRAEAYMLRKLEENGRWQYLGAELNPTLRELADLNDVMERSDIAADYRDRIVMEETSATDSSVSR